MNQFSEAIKTGIMSARVADANIKEILAAISEASEAVEEFTEGKVGLIRGKVQAEGSNVFTAAVLAATAIGLGQENMVDAILARRKIAPHSTRELARIELSSTGYPCAMIFDKGKYTCHDKEAWVKLLKELLASPDAGKAILRLQAEKPSAN